MRARRGASALASALASGRVVNLPGSLAGAIPSLPSGVEALSSLGADDVPLEAHAIDVDLSDFGPSVRAWPSRFGRTVGASPSLAGEVSQPLGVYLVPVRTGQ